MARSNDFWDLSEKVGKAIMTGVGAATIIGGTVLAIDVTVDSVRWAFGSGEKKPEKDIKKKTVSNKKAASNKKKKKKAA